LAAAQGYIPLQWAALNNRVAECTYLLSNGADINAADSTGQTALHWAAVRGSLPVLETLLRNGADAGLEDARGYTICHVAAQVCGAACVCRAPRVGGPRRAGAQGRQFAGLLEAAGASTLGRRRLWGAPCEGPSSPHAAVLGMILCRLLLCI
jgi:hypothetical protein